MEIQIALAASGREVGFLFDQLRSRGFYISQDRSRTGEMRAAKEYRDKTTNEFRARITLRATYKDDEYEYRLYVETHAHDSVTGEGVAEGNSLEEVSKHHRSMYKQIIFLDSVLTMPECTGYSGEDT